MVLVAGAGAAPAAVRAPELRRPGPARAPRRLCLDHRPLVF
jgi:hypothetical protein